MKASLVNLLIKGGSCVAGAVALGGTSAAVYLGVQPVEAEPTPAPTPIVESAVIEETPPKEAEAPKPPEEAKTEEVKKETPAPQPTPAPTTTAKPTPAQPAAPEAPKYDSWMDYATKNAGLCPSQQPNPGSAYWEWDRFKTAAGAYTVPEHSPITVAQAYWEWYKAGRISGVQQIGSFFSLGTSNTHISGKGSIFIDFDTMKVYWDGTWEEDQPWPAYKEYPAEWDEIVAEVQAFLDGLNSRYNSRCPND